MMILERKQDAGLKIFTGEIALSQCIRLGAEQIE